MFVHFAMQNNHFLLYGANGYTGELIARYANKYNLQPILAGRRKEALIPLAEKLKLPYKVIKLDDQAALIAALQEVEVVVHAAGPFHITAKPMIDACLKTGTHYTDINGDLDVFQMLQNYDEAAKQAGIMIMSGVGFDVVPTDCMALFLQKLLPDATALKIAFATPGGGLSHGTATTSIFKMGEPGAERKGGKIVPVPLGQKGMWVDFADGSGGEKKLFVMSLPWGDIFTAYVTTGIPDIESYTAMPKAVHQLLKFQGLFNPLLRTSLMRRLVQKIIDNKAPGLDDTRRHKSKSLVWGQATNNAGKKATARLSAPDAYTLTADSTLLITQKILQGQFSTGYQTPAGVYGEDLVMEIPGVKREIVE
ncbi:MAG: Saccharopine dehydrogenase [Segetibacter sp.]|nr:Saccharopine dehydrogenase [Segetibacter sp.]